MRFIADIDPSSLLYYHLENRFEGNPLFGKNSWIYKDWSLQLSRSIDSIYMILYNLYFVNSSSKKLFLFFRLKFTCSVKLWKYKNLKIS